MKCDMIQSLTETFEAHAQETEGGVEFWLARDLQHLLGYTKWDNFLNVVSKAKTACEVSEHDIADHFADVGKMVDLGSGSRREVDDIMLTRCACCLIAQNGDPRKQEIAFAQTCFTVQTRRGADRTTLAGGGKGLRPSETGPNGKKAFPSYLRTDRRQPEFCDYPRHEGDQALFGKPTHAMKSQWEEVPASRPLADFAPTIILKAKDFAAEITIFNSKQRQFATESEISSEHITNNQTVRKTLLERGIRPESLPASEDIKKVERRLTSEQKKSLKNPNGLDS